MIGYAVWDQTTLISNRFLRRYIQDTFWEIRSNVEFGGVLIHHDLEHIVGAYGTDYKHLIVFQSGHTSRTPLRLIKAIEEFCKRDFFVAGHIIHHVNTYPFLHPQMFIINLDRYRELGCPHVGLHEDSEVLHLHMPIRSPENIHDDYTPLWLKPSGETIPCVRRDFGWNLIHESLDHDIPVINLSNAIRSSKRFLYPHDRPHQFAMALEQLSKDELVAIPTRMNDNQRQYLQELLSPGVRNGMFLFNTDPLIQPIPDGVQPKRLFGPAAGFKLMYLWHEFGETGDVVYFDHNRDALKMWQTIVSEWSGDDFAGFCRDNGFLDGVTRDDYSRIAEIHEAFGGEDAFKDIWKRFTGTQPKFIWCDLLRHYESLLAEMAPSGNLVWYSNIFKYFEAIRRYGVAGADDREKRFIETLVATDPEVFCIAFDAIGRGSDLLNMFDERPD